MRTTTGASASGAAGCRNALTNARYACPRSYAHAASQTGRAVVPRLMSRKYQTKGVYIMRKLTILTSVACAAILCAATVASAQNLPSNSSSAQSGSTSTPSPGSNSNGNNLDTSSKSPSVNPATSPTTAGQDTSHGNDMVSPNGTSNGGMKQANAARPDFSTLDTKNKGSLTATDVRNNAWLSKNFSRCDSDHDGTLSRAEYAPRPCQA